jgi:Tir chaperone protein (CesT) family
MMNLAQVVQVLSAQIGKPVRLSQHGTVRLNYENRLDLILETRSDFDLYFYGVLGELPLDDAEKVYQRLLQWQLLGQFTGHASFAIDLVHRQVLIQRHLDLRVVEPTDLVEAIQDFFIRFDHWQTRWLLPDDGSASQASVAEAPVGLQSVGWIRA